MAGIPLVFFAGAAERMRIDSSGNVGIGTTNPLGDLTISNGGAHGLEIQPNITNNVNRITNYNRSNNTYVSFLLDGLEHQFNTSGNERLHIESGGTTRVEIKSGLYLHHLNSGAGNSTLKYGTSSGLVSFDTSSRLVKEQIIDCPYGIAELKQLQPRKYFRTDDQAVEIGFIADELVQVMPEFVPIGPKSVITKNEDDTEEIPLGVNYEKLTSVLTKALQEAIAKIETLETQNASLEARLTALEGA